MPKGFIMQVAALVPEDQLIEIQDALAAEPVSVIHVSHLTEAVTASLIFCDADTSHPWTETVRDILVTQPDARIVMLSRLADERMWMEVLAHGVYDLLPKPGHPRDLRTAVRNALDLQPLHSMAA